MVRLSLQDEAQVSDRRAEPDQIRKRDAARGCASLDGLDARARASEQHVSQYLARPDLL